MIYANDSPGILHEEQKANIRVQRLYFLIFPGHSIYIASFAGLFMWRQCCPATVVAKSQLSSNGKKKVKPTSHKF